MGLLIKLGLFWLAFLGSVYAHELGHFGKPRIVKWFPVPVGQSRDALFRYGGLVVNAGLAFGILLLNSDNLFLNLFGLANFAHFVLYCFWGSFNFEVDWPRRLWKFVTFDDIPNKLWWVFVPIGLLSLWLGGSFYWNIAITFFGGAL